MYRNVYRDKLGRGKTRLTRSCLLCAQPRTAHTSGTVTTEPCIHRVSLNAGAESGTVPCCCRVGMSW